MNNLYSQPTEILYYDRESEAQPVNNVIPDHVHPLNEPLGPQAMMQQYAPPQSLVSQPFYPLQYPQYFQYLAPTCIVPISSIPRPKPTAQPLGIFFALCGLLYNLYGLIHYGEMVWEMVNYYYIALLFKREEVLIMVCVNVLVSSITLIFFLVILVNPRCLAGNPCVLKLVPLWLSILKEIGMIFYWINFCPVIKDKEALSIFCSLVSIIFLIYLCVMYPRDDSGQRSKPRSKPWMEDYDAVRSSNQMMYPIIY